MKANADGPRRLMRPVQARWLTGGLAGMALVAAGWWAAWVTLGPVVEVPHEIESVTATVVEASVGRSLSLSVTVEQPFVPVATNGLAGTVTSVELGGRADTGDVLYAVDTVPVRAVEGETPFWRDLRSGVEGEDVAQLQQALSKLGHYNGAADGMYQFATGHAVRAWQRELGIPEDGIVALGELVAVPRLPAALDLAEEIVPGARLAGGEPAVFAATGDMKFALVVSPDQANLIPAGASITVEHGDREWDGVLSESSTAEDGDIRFAVTSPDGGLVCGRACGSLPAAERTSLRAQVEVVPEVSGPAVPVAAIRTDPDGTAWVRMADGTRREVSVLGSSGGVAVVEGLDVGEQVQVIGPAADGAPPAGPPVGPPSEVGPGPAGEGADGAGG